MFVLDALNPIKLSLAKDMPQFAGPSNHEICRVGTHKDRKYLSDFFEQSVLDWQGKSLPLYEGHADSPRYGFLPEQIPKGYVNNISFNDEILSGDIFFTDSTLKNNYDAGMELGFSIRAPPKEGFTMEDTLDKGVSAMNSSLLSLAVTMSPAVKSTVLTENLNMESNTMEDTNTEITKVNVIENTELTVKKVPVVDEKKVDEKKVDVPADAPVEVEKEVEMMPKKEFDEMKASLEAQLSSLTSELGSAKKAMDEMVAGQKAEKVKGVMKQLRALKGEMSDLSGYEKMDMGVLELLVTELSAIKAVESTTETVKFGKAGIAKDKRATHEMTDEQIKLARKNIYG